MERDFVLPESSQGFIRVKCRFVSLIILKSARKTALGVVEGPAAAGACINPSVSSYRFMYLA
jgi:hypothetical protein